MIPRVLLDVDGVIADFLTPFVGLFNVVGCRRHGENWKMRGVDDVTHYAPAKSFDVDRDFEDEVSSLVTEGWCSALRPFPEAHDGVNMLRLDADVYFVTASFKVCPSWASERVSWLQTHFGADENHIISTHAKHTIAGDVFVDDKKDNLVKWAEHFPFGTPVRWRRSKFEDYFTGHETNRWSDVSRIVAEREEFLGQNVRHWRPDDHEVLHRR